MNRERTGNDDGFMKNEDSMTGMMTARQERNDTTARGGTWKNKNEII